MPWRERLEDAVGRISCSFNGFMVACFVILAWAVLGPHYDYSDTWQLVINTGTTIVTFLMVFLVGATQQRGAANDRMMLELTERHVSMIEDHTDAWEKHSKETHDLLTQVHTLTVEVHALASELHNSHRSFVERVAIALNLEG